MLHYQRNNRHACFTELVGMSGGEALGNFSFLIVNGP